MIDDDFFSKASHHPLVVYVNVFIWLLNVGEIIVDLKVTVLFFFACYTEIFVTCLIDCTTSVE